MPQLWSVGEGRLETKEMLHLHPLVSANNNGHINERATHSLAERISLADFSMLGSEENVILLCSAGQTIN